MIFDDLPDDLLVQILDKLPCYSLVHSQCVSKRWLTLISNSPCFSQKICPTLVFFAAEGFPNHEKRLELFTMSKLWDFRKQKFPTIVSPRFTDQVVIAAHNDLLLCEARNHHDRNYYIFNPHTLQRFVIPPPPSCSQQSALAGVGFLYNDHSWVIVRIYFPRINGGNQINQIFSSECREWREYTLHPVGLTSKLIYREIDLHPCAIAYKGKLYWADTSRDGVIFQLGLFSDRSSSTGVTTVTHCPDPFYNKPHYYTTRCLGVCQGRLRMVQMFAEDCFSAREPRQLFFSVWELKKGQISDGAADEWCLLENAILDPFVLDDPTIAKQLEVKSQLLALDPNNEEIVYLNVSMHIVMCNIRTGTLKIVREGCATRSRGGGDRISAFPFASPATPHESSTQKMGPRSKEVHVNHMGRYTPEHHLAQLGAQMTGYNNYNIREVSNINVYRPHGSLGYPQQTYLPQQMAGYPEQMYLPHSIQQMYSPFNMSGGYPPQQMHPAHSVFGYPQEGSYSHHNMYRYS